MKVAFHKNQGFSVLELLATLGVLAVLAGIAIPAFALWLPDQNLKTAARDLYSNLQLTKLMAVRQNMDAAVVFDNTVSPGRYFICSTPGANGIWDGPAAMGGDDEIEKQVIFSNYDDDVDYGSGSATDDLLGSGSAPANAITYLGPNDTVVFQPDGTLFNPGYVYLANAEGESYGLGTPSTAGVIILRKWKGNSWE